MSKTVALLPIKHNSQRVPGKNFRELGGKPLFRWVFDTLDALDEIHQIVINTDVPDYFEEQLSAVSEKLLVRPRLPELQGDETSMNLILADDIAQVEADTYVMTHATNPFLKCSSIKAALQRFDHSDCDSLFTVNRIQTRFYDQQVRAINHDPDHLIQTQDLEPWFEENSCLYIFTRDSFASTQARIGRHPVMHELERLEAVDIDTEQDWKLAEALAMVTAHD